MSSIVGWREENIGKNLKLLSGFPFPSIKFSSHEGFPLIRIRDVVGSKIETYYLGEILPLFVIRDGDVLIGMDGDFNLAKWKNEDALLNQRILKVDVFDSNKFDIDFVYYWLQPYIKKINDLTAATTVKHLSTKDIRKAKATIPGISVQKSIGTILRTIDQTIEKTEALIEKYQQIKAGLMHDLFTRGIGTDGKLRPPREQAPELYQQTPIGWIPKEWGVKLLGNLTSKIVDGIHHTPSYVEYGVPFVTVKNLTGSETIDFTNLNYIDNATHEMCYSRADPQHNDVLVTKDGTLGVSRIVKEGMPEFSIFVSVALLRVAEELTSEWLHFFFESGEYLKQLGNLSSGTGLKHIHLEHFRKFQIALPRRGEQSWINDKVQTIDAKLISEKNFLSKKVKQKSGLMHDLLTGKVPVKIDTPNQETT